MSLEGKQDTMVLVSNISTANETVTMKTNMDSLPETLSCIERFLRASGFVFDGHLGVIKTINYSQTSNGN